jgi:hypothetical protein
MRIGDHFPKSKLDIVASDGTLRSSSVGVVSGDSILIEDVSAVIEVGDEMRRTLPNGSEEVFVVDDPAFREKFHTIDAHYQVKVHKRGTFPRHTGGHYNLHVTGNNSRVNIGSTDRSTNVVVEGDVFGNLTAALRKEVKDSEQLARYLASIEEMRNSQKEPKSYAATYQRFISMAADHIEIIGQFLPALTSFFQLDFCSRLPKSLGHRTFFVGGAVATFQHHWTAAAIRAFLASIWPPIPGILMQTPSR